MERAFFGTILKLREEKHEAGRNVVTSQCRDVSTSRHRVNMKKKSTSSQRRDVIAISPSQSLKAKRDQNSGVSKNVRIRARKAKQQRPRSAEKRPTFVFSPISDKTADVL